MHSMTIKKQEAQLLQS